MLNTRLYVQPMGKIAIGPNVTKYSFVFVFPLYQVPPFPFTKAQNLAISKHTLVKECKSKLKRVNTEQSQLHIT